MVYLGSVSPKGQSGPASDATAERAPFPFTVPAVRSLMEAPLVFPSPVTFFVGENGSGKSTVLEGMAAAAGLPTVGATEVRDDATLGAARLLGRAFRLSWTKRTHRGFFLRAEDFFGFTKSLAKMRAELTARLAELDVEYADRSAHAKVLARKPMVASLHDMTLRYGVDLDANSHGQSFLKLFQNRFVPGGLYLLDEPEAPLSPQSQLALIALMDEMVHVHDAQFIVATHSPILLALPEATIYSFDELPVQAVAYDQLDHVRLTRDFLNDPERYLRHLTSAPEESVTQ
jgi:predicted ATPase